MNSKKINVLYSCLVTIPILVFSCLVFDSPSAEATDCGLNQFYFQSYDNRHTRGQPRYTGCVGGINFNADARSPGPFAPGKGDSMVETDFSPVGVGRENFSIYCKGVFEFERDIYVFFVAADDGVILIFDGKQIVYDWRDHAYLEYRRELYVEAGFHTIEIYYYQHGGGAELEYNHYRTNRYP